MADDNGTREKIGAHGEAIRNLKDAVEELAAEVKALRSSVDQAKGGWKAMTILGAATGGAVSAALAYFGMGKP